MLSERCEKIIIAGIVLIAIIFGCLLWWAASLRIQLSKSLDDSYRTIIASPTPTIVCNNDIITVFNPAAEGVFGIRSADIIGQRASEALVPIAYRTKHLAAIEKLIRKRGEMGISRYIIPIDDENGKAKKWQVLMSYIVDKNGTIVMTARLVDFDDSSLEWIDVTDGRKYRRIIKFEPINETI